MSIQRIADEAEVSTATVSRIINKKANVSEMRRRKVEAAMQKFGYRPEPVSLRRGPKASHPFLKHRCIALLGFSGPGWNRTPIGSQALEGASRAAKRHGIRLVIDFLSGTDDLPPLVRAGRIDGLLLNGPGPGDKMMGHLKHFPAMRMFSRDLFHWGDRSMPDHRHVGRLAFDYFQKSGCQSVCCITSDCSEDRYWRDRADAFQLAAKVAGIPCVMLGEHEPEAHSQQGEFLAAERRVQELARLPQRPDALFVANSFGPYVYEHLRRAGIRPMEDIQLVMGDYQICPHYLDPDPVKIDVHAEEVGRIAFEFLLARIAAPDGPRLTHFVEPDLLLPGQQPRRAGTHTDGQLSQIAVFRSAALG